MGSVTEFFGNLTEVLQAERHKATTAKNLNAGGEILLQRLLKPFLPVALRYGPGTIVDLKDRSVGPFDLVGCWEAYPRLGEGSAATYLADGVAFCLQVRNWSQDDLTDFGTLAANVKKLELRRKEPISCFAVSYELLSLSSVEEFLKSPAGAGVDGVVSIGHNVMIRNAEGLYGSPEHVPFVTERSGPEALKSFALLLQQLSQSLLGIPFGMADYQHL